MTHIFTDNSKIIAEDKELISTIIKMMNIHINDAEICKNSCSLLWSLTSGNSKNNIIYYQSLKSIFATGDNQTIANKEGVIKTVMKAMNNHIDNIDVCFQGCKTLWDIIVNNSKKKTLNLINI